MIHNFVAWIKVGFVVVCKKIFLQTTVEENHNVKTHVRVWNRQTRTRACQRVCACVWTWICVYVCIHIHTYTRGRPNAAHKSVCGIWSDSRDNISYYQCTFYAKRHGLIQLCSCSSIVDMIVGTTMAIQRRYIRMCRSAERASDSTTFSHGQWTRGRHANTPFNARTAYAAAAPINTAAKNVVAHL